MSIKDPAVVDALFQELSVLHVHPDRLEFASDVPADRMLGGGFGDVLRATLHPASESLQPNGTRSCGGDQHIIVAIKRLKDLHRIDFQRRKRMVVREIHLLAKVKHPNIVPFRGFHVDFEGSIAWLVSDWAEFGNILDYLRDNDVSVIERLRLLRDTATALAYMHSLDPLICHGDIKAANVLVGKDRQAMLCDFGLARIVDDEGFKHLETSAEFRASIPWCSPEVLDGQGANPESDIWALGCLVWEVATHTTPFSDFPSKLAIMTAIIKRRLPQPDQQSFFQLVPRLGEFMKDCWNEDPASRPSAQHSCHILANIMTLCDKRQSAEEAQGVRIPEAGNVGVSNTKAPPSPPKQRKSRTERFLGVFRPSFFTNPQRDVLAEPVDPNDLSAKIRRRRSEQGGMHKQGGFSDVYEGWMIDTNQRIAIKCLRAVHVDGADVNGPDIQDRFHKRLKRQMMVMGEVGHIRIARLMGHALFEGRPALIMPWYSNGSLSEYLPKCNEVDRKRIIMHVGEALGCLHRNVPPIAHSNIKPGNILINDEGNAVLSDFCLAKILDGSHTGLTTSGDPKYTIRYCAPETLDGSPGSTETDVYSYACLVYEILSGEEPSGNSKTMHVLLVAKIHAKLPNKPEPSIIPELLWTLLTRCWSTNLEDRPTMNELSALNWLV